MVRTTRRDTPKPKTIGFIGLGELSAKNIKALLEDQLDEDEAKKATFILPATKEHFTDSKSIECVADWMDDNEIAYEVVTDDDVPRSLRQLVKRAEKVHKAEDVSLGVVNVLKDADGDVRLFVFYDEDLPEDDDGGTEEAVLAAFEADLPVFDMCSNLEPMEEDDDDDDDDGGQAAEKDEDDVPRRSKAAKVDDDDDEGEEVVDNSKRAGLPPYAEARKLTIRPLRTMAREREMAPHRKIGSMDKDTVLELLYPDGADTVIPGGAVAASDVEPTEAAPTRGRKAAAETIDEEVAAAARTVTKASSNGHVASVGDSLIELIAQAIAARVKELVD